MRRGGRAPGWAAKRVGRGGGVTATETESRLTPQHPNRTGQWLVALAGGGEGGGGEGGGGGGGPGEGGAE